MTILYSYFIDLESGNANAVHRKRLSCTASLVTYIAYTCFKIIFFIEKKIYNNMHFERYFAFQNAYFFPEDLKK